MTGEQLAHWIEESTSTVFFGGAGMSTESGIPDFSSAGGLYTTQHDLPFPAEYMLSHSCLASRGVLRLLPHLPRPSSGQAQCWSPCPGCPGTSRASLNNHHPEYRRSTPRSWVSSGDRVARVGAPQPLPGLWAGPSTFGDHGRSWSPAVLVWGDGASRGRSL